MLVSDFDYYLPKNLIAKYPLKKRSDSRLMYLNRYTGAISHMSFKDLPQLLTSNDLLVMNNTKVIPAKFYVNKITGGKIEILLERILKNNKILVQIRNKKSIKNGDKLLLGENIWLEVLEKKGNLFELFYPNNISILNILKQYGKIPLPPYMKRIPDDDDIKYYQTIYAKHSGSIAAPTAGLHFDKELMNNLSSKNVDISFVTLHIGFGTFQTVNVEKISDHKMHSEYISISENTCNKIRNIKKNKGKIVAVGTTTLRTLESSWIKNNIIPYNGYTDIFIYPPYKFNNTDALITNFHMPKTSLLMLVSAFAGYKNIMNAYKEAIAHNYKFYSYGDAMIII